MFSSQRPLWLISLVLFFGGMARSMQFTALNTIAFSDVPQTEMASANTLFSTAFQLAMGLGVALGAIAWRIGSALAPEAGAATASRIAFLVVAVTSMVGVWYSVRLKPGAGDHVSRNKF